MSLYLVQALYGTKPRVPEQQQVKTEDTAVDGGTPMKEEGVDELMSNLSVISQQIVTTRAAESVPTVSSNDVRIPNASIIENLNHQELDAALATLKALYKVPTRTSTGVHMGSATSPIEHAGIHPARQRQLLESEDQLDRKIDSMEKDERWAPTGSNMLPLGVQEKREAFTTATTRHFNTAHVPTQREKTQQLSKPLPTVFLPPKKGYYDQTILAQVFKSEALWKLGSWCGTCWTMKHSSSENCQRICPLCGTKDHPGKTCPRLYCSPKWYKKRQLEIPSDRQLRPFKNELLMLSKLGMIQPSSDTTILITVNKAHPGVMSFYDGQWPLLLRVKPKSTGRSSEAAAGSSTRVKAVSARRLTTPIVSTMNIQPETEDHLQKLEEEVLRLRKENIIKDREISLLRSEVERLRVAEGDVQIGNKRPRLRGDDALLSALH